MRIDNNEKWKCVSIRQVSCVEKYVCCPVRTVISKAYKHVVNDQKASTASLNPLEQ